MRRLRYLNDALGDSVFGEDDWVQESDVAMKSAPAGIGSATLEIEFASKGFEELTGAR